MRDTMVHYRFRDARTALMVALVGLWASAGCCAWSIPSYRFGEAARHCPEASTRCAPVSCGIHGRPAVGGEVVGYELVSALPISEGDFPGEMISVPTPPVRDPLSRCLGHFSKTAEPPPAKFHPYRHPPSRATSLAAAGLVCSDRNRIRSTAPFGVSASNVAVLT